MSVKIRFGPFNLDLDTRQLSRESREVHLSPKAFELLVTLVSDRPKVLPKAGVDRQLFGPKQDVRELPLTTRSNGSFS